MESESQLPVLSATEQRVLGTLMEKSKITPDYYPMTLNGLTAACNQKTSRFPVTDYSEEEVMQALNSLKGQSLVATAVGGGSRVMKFKHNFLTVFPMSDAEMAVICLLLIRGAQTPGELNTNANRLHEFVSLEGVLDTVQKLRFSNPPFIKELEKRPGQKEARYIHLLGSYTAREEVATEREVRSTGGLEQRVVQLESELAEVKEQLAQIRRELFGN
ncbi:MAG: YceH family protein [Bacteroidia bacterium]|nr:YceH family protein [Bacteroidia bacterium]